MCIRDRGKAIEVTWTKSSENAITHYYDAKTGEEIQINTGKTYICLLYTSDIKNDTLFLKNMYIKSQKMQL